MLIKTKNLTLVLTLLFLTTLFTIKCYDEYHDPIPSQPIESPHPDILNTPTPHEFKEDVLFRKFERFMEKYKKTYDTMDEFKARFEIYKKNYLTAKNMTEDDNDLEGMRLGTTPFSDLTPEEFEKNYLSNVNETDLPGDMQVFKYDDEEIGDAEEEVSEEEHERNLQSVPSRWDWRSKGVVTRVKHQGRCGGCWAFSAAAVIEGQYARKYKKLRSFSEQQMIDCSYYDNGCNGGLMHTAFNYVRRAGGLMKRSTYPYLGYRGVCKFRSDKVVARVRGYTSAGTTNENTIKAFLYKTGPLAITINARNLQYYKRGVYNVPYRKCPYAPDHGVVLVGYGTTSKGMPYWIIKNSWGPKWGENGYFRIRRGKGLCGVNRYVYSAKLA